MRFYSTLIAMVLLFANLASAEPFSLTCAIPNQAGPDEYFGNIAIDVDKSILTIVASGRGSVGAKGEFALTTTARAYKGVASGKTYHSTFILDRSTGHFAFHMVTYRNDLSDDKFTGECKPSPAQ